MHKRDATRGAFLLYLSPASRNFYCALRNEVSCLIDASKSNYLMHRLTSTNRSSCLWFKLWPLGLAKFESSVIISLGSINLFTSVHSSFSVSFSSPVSLAEVSLYVFSRYVFMFSFLMSYHSSPFLSSIDFTFFFSYITPNILFQALIKCSSNFVEPDDINRRLLLDNFL